MRDVEAPVLLAQAALAALQGAELTDAPDAP
jgi:hypothetical protein